MEFKKVPIMRSVRETARIFKELDPDTEITEYTLRQMIKNNSIPYVKTGMKFILNVDLLMKHFYGEMPND